MGSHEFFFLIRLNAIPVGVMLDRFESREVESYTVLTGLWTEGGVGQKGGEYMV